MKIIPLTKGLFTIIDDDDYAKVSQYSWQAVQVRKDRFYAYRITKTKTVKYRREKGKHILLHRELMDAKTGEYVDHKNRMTLDNRRGNLRVCTNSQNCINRAPSKIRKTSRFKGVRWLKKLGKWQSAIRKDYKTYYLGLFTSEEDAARVYNKKAKELYGEFAYLNPIP